ncbi:hypothetical protein JXA47_14050, partial [Candidatus Sumerlaeota bacterium]|nr:hypothetical protein [Candidatus Sumerlaeota bacterium]
MDGLIRFGVGLSLLVPVLSPLAQTAEILQATDASPVVLGQDPGLPSDLFCVRVAGMATETSSRQAAERLSALGYQRIEPRVDGVIHSVEAGVFESTLDAMLCVEDLQRRGFHRVTVERIPTTDSTRAALTRWLPIEPAFTLEARRIEDTPDPQINMESDPLIARGQASEALDTAEGDADLEDLISSLSDDDPRRGWALLRRAHRHREERHWEEALEMFQAVSDGAVAVRRSDRTNAMYRVGWILQYRIGSRRGAYQAFRETELFVDDPVLQARCRAEQAWIMFEMVRYEEIGEWDEVRRFAAQTLA